MGKHAARREWVVRVLQPDRDGYFDIATSRAVILRCADVKFGPGWISCVVENADGSLLRATFPSDLVVEVDETIPAREIRAARRRLKQQDEDDKPQPMRSRRQDPAYR